MNPFADSVEFWIRRLCLHVYLWVSSLNSMLYPIEYDDNTTLLCIVNKVAKSVTNKVRHLDCIIQSSFLYSEIIWIWTQQSWISFIFVKKRNQSYDRWFLRTFSSEFINNMYVIVVFQSNWIKLNYFWVTMTVKNGWMVGNDCKTCTIENIRWLSFLESRISKGKKPVTYRILNPINSNPYALRQFVHGN